MKYLQLFSLHNLALISDWLEKRGELFVDIYRPHSGGSSFQYFVHSLDEFKELVRNENRREVVFTIFREQQFALRGIADENLLEKALSTINDGEWYDICSLKHSFAQPINFVAANNSYDELRSDFSKVFGQPIGFGQDPFDVYKDEWFKENPQDVLQVSRILVNGNETDSVNQNSYDEVIKNPDRYRWIEELWSK